MKTFSSYSKFQECFENVVDLEELKNKEDNKRKKKISKENGQN